MSTIRSNEVDPLIYNFQHLTEYKNPDVALQTLRRIASLVKPIMRQHNWKVGLLGEFFPKDKGLLGLNTGAGQTIHIRMRYSLDPNQFQPFEMTMDIVLHELSHNQFGPHDKNFHALWDQLRDEYHRLTHAGFTGQAFLSQGYTVGGKTIPKDEARRIARATAGVRRKNQMVVNRKLGGQGPPLGAGRADMRGRIANAAAGRIGQGCASGLGKANEKQLVDQARSNGFKTKAEEDDANEIAIQQAIWELAQEEREEIIAVAYGGSGRSSKEPIVIPSSSPPRSITAAAYNSPAKNSKSSSTADVDSPRKKGPAVYEALLDEEDQWWQCEICTLINKVEHLICDACGVEKLGPKLGSSLPKSSSASSGRSPFSAAPLSRNAPSRVPSRPLASRPAPQRILGVQKLIVAKVAPKTWTCQKCRNIMESEWWTCSKCGSMKKSS